MHLTQAHFTPTNFKAPRPTIYSATPAMPGPLTIQFNVNVNNYYIMPSPPSSSVPMNDHPGQDDVDPFNWNDLNFDDLSFDFDEDDATSTQFSTDEEDDSLCSAFTGLERMTTPFGRRLVSETGSRSHGVSRSATWSQAIIAPTPAYGYDTPLCKFLQEWNAPTRAHSRYHPYRASVSPETKSTRASSLPPLRRAAWRSVSRLARNSTWHARTSSTPDVDSPCPQESDAMLTAVSNVYSEAFTANFTWPRIPPGAISTYSSLAGALGDSPTYSSPSSGSPSSSQSSSSSGFDSGDDFVNRSQASTPAR